MNRVKYYYHASMAAVLNAIARFASSLLRKAGKRSNYHERHRDIYKALGE